ncbi:putative retrotransposon hot spot (RHS) protein [Trypanosoma cruzi]|nr:putative retrotransposon hot spot (RHS) protein [Trypanosoma cruzi]
MKGYVIYDFAEQGTSPAGYFLPYDEWGMILVSPLNVHNHGEWETPLKAERIIANCSDWTDVKAMCAWMRRDGATDGQAEYWRIVKGCMDKVGPIPRYIFDANKFIPHSAAIQSALDGSSPGMVESTLQMGE